eukprot:scaffold1499_cov255-Pinguiococcus_pyrenoidosus.AAC.7
MAALRAAGLSFCVLTLPLLAERRPNSNLTRTGTSSPLSDGVTVCSSPVRRNLSSASRSLEVVSSRLSKVLRWFVSAVDRHRSKTRKACFATFGSARCSRISTQALTSSALYIDLGDVTFSTAPSTARSLARSSDEVSFTFCMTKPSSEALSSSASVVA